MFLSSCVLTSQSAAYASAGRLTVEPLAKITVEAGQNARIDTPVSVSLDGMGTTKLALYEIKGSKRTAVAAQIEPGNPPRLWWILSGTTPAGSKRTYELVEGQAHSAPGVRAEKNDKVVLIKQGAAKVLSYNHAIVPPPAGQSELYNRSGFIHPLWSPSGSVLTNIHPKDHYHHVGIWMPWTKTTFEGKEVDFWNLGKGEGTVRFKRFLSTTSGPVYGGFVGEHEHVALKTDQGEKVVLKEVWDVRVYNIGGPEKGYWLWDFVSIQRCVADSPLHLEKYRYGGFGFRGAAEWKGENAAYLTSEGKTRKDGHATRARWCDTAGVSGGKWKGVTHFSHPKNFRHPEPMRIWPEFHKEVFFNWAPEQLDAFDMEPGKDWVFRYRLYVHEGKIDVERTEQLWHDYAEPPEMKVEFVRPKDAVVLLDARTELSKHWTAGKDKNDEEKKIGWDVEGGVAMIAPKSGSIWTKQDFSDFKMHIEFKTPQMPPNVRGQGRGNSGVYIQRRYEIQILDSYGLPRKNNECGGIYKFRAPDKNMCKKPGEWQSYDIIFRAARYEGKGEDAKKKDNARITVRHNGVLIHNNVDVPNKTGAGKPEGPEPGQILLQDHGNAVSFRNIWIVPM